jgi:hypothetical protein
VISFFQIEVSAGLGGAGWSLAGFAFRRNVISFFQIDVSSRRPTSAPCQA